MGQQAALLSLPQQVEGEAEERQLARSRAGVGEDALGELRLVGHPGYGVDGCGHDLAQAPGVRRGERVQVLAGHRAQARIGQHRLQEVGAQRHQHADGLRQGAAREQVGEFVGFGRVEAEDLLELVDHQQQSAAVPQLEQPFHRVRRAVAAQHSGEFGRPLLALGLGQAGFQQRQQSCREGSERGTAARRPHHHRLGALRAQEGHDSGQGQRRLARARRSHDGDTALGGQRPRHLLALRPAGRGRARRRPPRTPTDPGTATGAARPHATRAGPPASRSWAPGS